MGFVAAVSGFLVSARGLAAVVVVRGRGCVARGWAVLRLTARCGAVALRGRSVALVVARPVAGGRSLLVPVSLFGVAALFGVALPGRVARFRRVRGPRLLRGARTGILRVPAVLLLVVFVAGAALAAVARAVSHRWHSWFCGVRMGRFCWAGYRSRRAGVGVGVDDRSGAVLTGMQGLGLLEPDDHRAVGLPPLFVEVLRQVPGESGGGEFCVSAHLLIIGRGERNDVVVGGQEPLVAQSTDTVGGRLPQQRLDLRRHDRSAEDPGEDVAHAVLELALDALDQTFLVAHRIACLDCAGTASVLHRLHHGIGRGGYSCSRRTLRIIYSQVTAVLLVSVSRRLGIGSGWGRRWSP